MRRLCWCIGGRVWRDFGGTMIYPWVRADHVGRLLVWATLSQQFKVLSIFLQVFSDCVCAACHREKGPLWKLFSVS